MSPLPSLVPSARRRAVSIAGMRTRNALLVWLAAFPKITVLLVLLQPVIGAWPLLARTFVISFLMVAILNFALVPFLQRRWARWLHED